MLVRPVMRTYSTVSESVAPTVIRSRRVSSRAPTRSVTGPYWVGVMNAPPCVSLAPVTRVFASTENGCDWMPFTLSGQMQGYLSNPFIDIIDPPKFDIKLKGAGNAVIEMISIVDNGVRLFDLKRVTYNFM